MNLSKSILAAVIVGTTLAGTVASCTKERVKKVDREEDGNLPQCGFGETPDSTANVNYGDCPACGLG